MIPRILGALLLMGTAFGAFAADGDLTLAYSNATVTLSASQVAALAHQDSTCMNGHEKKTHTYTGVPVKSLLALVGVPSGEKLRGGGLRLAVLARTRDNYAVLFALAEFDDAFTDRTILLVDKEDGQGLGQNQGPYMIVAPGDTRPARWARMVTSLEVVPVGEGRPVPSPGGPR